MQAERCDEQRDRLAIDSGQIGLERFKRLLDRLVPTDPFFLKKS